MIQAHDINKLPEEVMENLRLVTREKTLISKIQSIFESRPRVKMDSEDVIIFVYQEFNFQARRLSVTRSLVNLEARGVLEKTEKGVYKLKEAS